MTTDPAEVGINELAVRVDRVPATIRMWERTGVLPKALKPIRDSRQRRWWTETQVDGIIAWMQETDRYSGSNLIGWEPSPERTAEVHHSQRKPLIGTV